MRRKKLMACITAAAMVSTFLTACGQPLKEGAAAESTNETTTGTAEAAADDSKNGGDGDIFSEPKTLSVTTWDYDMAIFQRCIVEAFEEKHPNITIKVIDTPAMEYTQKIGVTMAAADTDPDVVWIKEMGDTLRMGNNGQLMSLTSFVERDNVDLSKYKGITEQFTLDGNLYGIPYTADWYVLYYNKNLFDKAGVPYPGNDMTWDEFDELTGKMTSGEGANKVFGSVNMTWSSLVTNRAVQDGDHTVLEKDYSFLAPYYERMLQLQNDGYIQNYSTLKTGNIHYSSIFKNQQAAMMPMGTWWIGTMCKADREGEIDFDWGIAKIPHSEETTAGYTTGFLTPIGISAYTDEPDLAWEFVKFATSEEAAGILAENGLFSGITTDSSLDTIAKTEGFPADPQSREAMEAEHIALEYPLDAKIEEVRAAINEQHEMILIEAASVEDGLTELSKRVAQIMGW